MTFNIVHFSADLQITVARVLYSPPISVDDLFNCYSQYSQRSWTISVSSAGICRHHHASWFNADCRRATSTMRRRLDKRYRHLRMPAASYAEWRHQSDHVRCLSRDVQTFWTEKLAGTKGDSNVIGHYITSTIHASIFVT